MQTTDMGLIKSEEIGNGHDGDQPQAEREIDY
jgi:hypothetical protein